MARRRFAPSDRSLSSARSAPSSPPSSGRSLLPAVFGDAFDESIIPFLWLLPGTLGFAASTVFSNALVGSSSPGLSSLGPIVSLTVGFALDLALIPQYDATGAAVAASAAFLAGGAVALATYQPRNTVLVASPARAASRRPRRAACARRSLAASACPTRHRLSGGATAGRR